MKSKSIRSLLALVAVLVAFNVYAHPMGNFSINHYSAISVEENGIRIHYIIDMADIPTFQEMPNLDSNGDKEISDAEASQFARSKAQEFRKNLSLLVNQTPVSLNTLESGLRILSGAGGLPTLLISANYSAPWNGDLLRDRNSIRYGDSNFVERIGWKEMILRKNRSVSILDASVPFTDRSKELTEYPADPTSSLPQETEATVAFLRPAVTTNTGGRDARATAGRDNNSAIATRATGATTAPSKRDDRFTRLISTKELSGEAILFSLLIAFALGAMHAMSPGHGKTIVAGYLVGARGTASHAVFLGTVVTLTHTIGVFVLGLITLYCSRFILPERLYPWLGFFSGISIVVIGMSLFRKRFLALRHKHHSRDQDHPRPYHHSDHDHDHDHPHKPHGHSHLPVDEMGAITWKSLLTVGISGGALPCPSALVVLLSAISLHRVGFGLLLILAFSLGLALVLTSIGLLLVYASHLTKRILSSSQLLLRMPLASSVIISILGFAIAIQSLR